MCLCVSSPLFYSYTFTYSVTRCFCVIYLCLSYFRTKTFDIFDFKLHRYLKKPLMGYIIYSLLYRNTITKLNYFVYDLYALEKYYMTCIMAMNILPISTRYSLAHCIFYVLRTNYYARLLVSCS